MIGYDITYLAENSYEEEVLEAIYDILIIPQSDQIQQVTEMELRNSINEEPFVFRNKFGFQVIRIRSIKVFRDFLFKGAFKVTSNHGLADDLFVSKPHAPDIRLERSFQIQHHLFLYQSPFTNISPQHSKLKLKYSKGQDQMEFAQALNHHVHELLTYLPDSTSVHTTANEVLQLGSGVCQDYVHLFLGMARQNRFPSRYVSGYLNQGSKLKGSAKMHAWAEIYLQSKGWVGLDPTNNLLVDHNYIKVAHGADYSDCSPIRGVLKTNGANSTNHQVKVALANQ